MDRHKPACRRRLCRATIILLILLGFSACQPALPQAAQATPFILQLQVSPSLQVLGQQFQACAEAQQNFGIVIQPPPAEAIAPGAMDLGLRWGASDSMQDYASVVGQETLVLVVDPQNPLKQMTLNEVQDIYKGQKQSWQAGDAIQAWKYPQGEDVQAIFESAIMQDQPISKHVVSLAPDPKAMREAIAGSPEAIGFLPKRWVDSSVKVLPLQNADTSSFQQPILAISKSEPKGPILSWILCLQEQLR